MNLDDTQRKQVAGWIAAGAKLSEIQNRLASEFGLRLTYMDVRLLVDDLKLTPRDPESPKPAAPPADPAPAPTASPPAPETPVSSGKVSVSVDSLARPGAMVSGKVTFSDGNRAEWYIDQTGRLGLVPQQTGYRPTPADLQQFQMSLEMELSKMGLA